MSVALGIMLAPLNSTMIAIALPDVARDFDSSVSTAGWLVTGYLIAMATIQPAAGKIGDRTDLRALFLVGVALFGAVSLGAALAPNLPTLLAFRTLQGVAGAFVTPNGTALIRHGVDASRRGGGFGLVGGGTAIATVLGAPVAGLLVEALGWRAIFSVNLALVVPALFLGVRYLPKTRPAAQPGAFDLLGTLILLVLLTGLAMLLIPATGGMDIRAVVAAGLGLTVLALAFVWRELVHPDPVVQLGVFRSRTFLGASLGNGLSNMSTYTLFLVVPLLLASREGSSVLQAGLTLTAMSIATVFVAPTGGWMVDRLGRRLPTVTGLSIAAAGAALIAVSGGDVGIGVLVVGLVLSGLGTGLSRAGLQTSAVESVDATQTGMAAGIYSTVRYLGSIVGSAILAGVVGNEIVAGSGMEFMLRLVLVTAMLAAAASLALRARPGE